MAFSRPSPIRHVAFSLPTTRGLLPSHDTWQVKEEIHRQLAEAQNQYKWWDLRDEVKEWLADPYIEHKVTPHGSHQPPNQTAHTLHTRLPETTVFQCAHGTVVCGMVSAEL